MRLHFDVWLPAPRDEVFLFFSDAMNLEALTPPWLRFTVLTPSPIQIARGTLIDYRLRLRGMPLRWQSEITCWEPPAAFVDEQRRGPYRRWTHTHTFVVVNGGTRVGDDVEFELPGGRIVEWFVARDVRNIFAYRQRVLRERFPAPDVRA